MESSHGVEPEIIFSPVKKRRYEQYSSELCVFTHKSESVDNLGEGNFQRFMTCKIVCKLRLENDPGDYGSNNIVLILQSSVKRKPKWHKQCHQHFTNQNKLDNLLSNQPIKCVSETESEVKGAFKLQDKCFYSGKHPTYHLF